MNMENGDPVTMPKKSQRCSTSWSVSSLAKYGASEVRIAGMMTKGKAQSTLHRSGPMEENISPTTPR